MLMGAIAFIEMWMIPVIIKKIVKVKPNTCTKVEKDLLSMWHHIFVERENRVY